LNDKAGEKYWSSVWKRTSIRKSAFHSLDGFWNFTTIQLDNYFRNHLAGLALTRSTSVMEVGCANSAWLPYFSQRFGFSPSGIDYSAVGVEQAKQVMTREGVEGCVIEADVFGDNPELLRQFDVVVSFGLVEHFYPPSECIGAMSKYLKSGGLMITLVPNFVGISGTLQRLLNREVYETHCLLSAEELSSQHQQAGLEVVSAGYFVSCNFGVCSVGNAPRLSPRHVALFFLRALSVIPGAIELWSGRSLPSKRWSPYVMCVARQRSSCA
jgi:cyclopropane fatty-acyl-phospholipid synthase-like methyltransferase